LNLRVRRLLVPLSNLSWPTKARSPPKCNAGLCPMLKLWPRSRTRVASPGYTPALTTSVYLLASTYRDHYLPCGRLYFENPNPLTFKGLPELPLMRFAICERGRPRPLVGAPSPFFSPSFPHFQNSPSICPHCLQPTIFSRPSSPKGLSPLFPGF